MKYRKIATVKLTDRVFLQFTWWQFWIGYSFEWEGMVFIGLGPFTLLGDFTE